MIYLYYVYLRSLDLIKWTNGNFTFGLKTKAFIQCVAPLIAFLGLFLIWFVGIVFNLESFISKHTNIFMYILLGLGLSFILYFNWFLESNSKRATRNKYKKIFQNWSKSKKIIMDFFTVFYYLFLMGGLLMILNYYRLKSANI